MVSYFIFCKTDGDKKSQVLAFNMYDKTSLPKVMILDILLGCDALEKTRGGWVKRTLPPRSQGFVHLLPSEAAGSRPTPGAPPR